ncbi:MAG TPA: thioredoxin domain-containing protein [Solirubrobacterales bacterium]
MPGEAEARRRQRLLQLAAGAVFLAIVAVAVLIVVNATTSGSGGDTKLEGVAAVNKFLAPYPQNAAVIGDPQAPVEVVEYGDLQCPVCKHYAEDVVPSIIEKQVKQGSARIDFRFMVVVGGESITAGAAAQAAALQGRGWNYIEIFYRNQGEENSGYAADDSFLEAIAKAAGVKNLDKWNADREDLTKWVEENTEEGENVGFTGTPSFTVRGPKLNEELEAVGTAPSTGELEEAIEGAH